MKVQLTEAFWDKAYIYQQDLQHGNLVLDGKVVVSAFVEGLDDDEEKGLIFKSLKAYDRHDFPLEIKTFIGNDLYFDTETFEVIDEKQYFKELGEEIPLKAPDQFLNECECSCHNKAEELIEQLAAALKDSYLGKIDEQCTYLEPAIKSILNNVLQYKEDKEYEAANVFDKIRIIIKNYEHDVKNTRTNYEAEAIRNMSFSKILEELANFGLFNIVQEEMITPVAPPTMGDKTEPTFNNKVIGKSVDKLRYSDKTDLV